VSIRIPAALSLLGFTLSLAPTAHSQTCTEIIRQTARQAHHTISAAELRIPEKARQHFEKARTASERKEPDTFARESAKALAVAPRYADVYLLRAAWELREGRYEAVLDTVAQARTIQSQLPWSAILIASALNQLHRYTEAVAELDRARSEEADSWQARYERARAETGRHDVGAALHWSELAVAAAPVGCTDARLVRANALQLAGQQTAVIAELETYLTLDRQGTRRTQVQALIQAQSQTLDHARGTTGELDQGLLAMK